MSRVCADCEGDVKRGSGTKCDGECSLWHHYKCLKVTEQAVVTARNRDKVWRCPKCRVSAAPQPPLPKSLQVVIGEHGSVVAAVAAAAAGGITPVGAGAGGTPYASPLGTPEYDVSGPHSAFPVDVVSTLLKLQKDVERILSKQDALQNTVAVLQEGQLSIHSAQTEIAKSLEFLSGKVHDFESTLTEHRSRLKALEDMQPEVQQLRAEVHKLQVERDDYHQQALLDCVELKGIAESAGDLRTVVAGVAAAIKCSIQPQDIREVRRLPSGRPHKSVSVQFACKEKRDDFLKCAKAKRPLKAAELGVGGGDTTLFINELLTSRRRMLLSRAKIYARENNIAFVWSRDGQVLMRKAHEDKQYVVIKHERDLERCFRDER